MFPMTAFRKAFCGETKEKRSSFRFGYGETHGKGAFLNYTEKPFATFE